jgi:putative transposase
MKDINHKISSSIVKYVVEHDCNINLEDLNGIRQTAKRNRFNKPASDLLNNWSFYQLAKFIEYKAKLQGVVVKYINPEYTSKSCSRCGNIETRNRKSFKCPICGYVSHADVNAAFNIVNDINNSLGDWNVKEKMYSRLVALPTGETTNIG